MHRSGRVNTGGFRQNVLGCSAYQVLHINVTVIFLISDTYIRELDKNIPIPFTCWCIWPNVFESKSSNTPRFISNVAYCQQILNPDDRWQHGRRKRISYIFMWLRNVSWHITNHTHYAYSIISLTSYKHRITASYKARCWLNIVGKP